MSKNHKPHDKRELQQADATAYALGELTPAEAAQFERAKALRGESSGDAASELELTRRMGQLLRADIAGDVAGIGSTSGESIRCSTQVREAVLAALDAQETALPPKLGTRETSVVRRSRTRIWAWGLVASVAVAIGVMFWFPAVQSVREAARRTEKTQTMDLRGGITIEGQPTDRIEPGGVKEIQLRSDSRQGGGAAKSVESGLANSDANLNGVELQGKLVQDDTKSMPLPQFGEDKANINMLENRELLESTNQNQTGRVLIGGTFREPKGDESGKPGESGLSSASQPEFRDQALGVTESLSRYDRRTKNAPSGEKDNFFADSLSTIDGLSEGESQKQMGLGRGLGSRTSPSNGRMSGESLDKGSDASNLLENSEDASGVGGGLSVRPTSPNATDVPLLRATVEAKGEELDSDGDGSADVFGDLGGRDESEHYGYRYESSRGGRGLRRNTANEQYKSVPENPFWRPIGERAMSTFSVDVDTASYANVRRFLNEGSLPPPDAVRLEEFINYFHYDYPQPEEGTPFAVDLKLFGCPWNAQHSLLRVGLHGREIQAEKRPVSNIVYLVDVSGSMSDDNKLPLLKRGLAMMVDHLSENDTVSIVTYAGDAGVRLEPTNGANKKRILDAIDSLQSGGSTNGAAGIDVAYRLAQQKFVSEGANRVILMTDGDLNVGVTSDDALVALIKEKAAGGVFLTVLGFGTGNLKDAKLEGLADNGNGIYGYIDSLGEAHKVLVEQMSGNLVTIAKDVKIQIEFNPAQVAGYRLIGYENRVMANQDFADDRKDAGEIGAGHTVTALYEIVPVGAMLGVIDQSSPTLKYQTIDSTPRSGDAQPKTEVRLTEAAQSGELALVALRFKTPEGTESRLVEFTAKAEVTSFSQADADCRFAAAVAGFGMRLRQSPYAGNITLDAIAEIASAAIGNDSSGHRAEFVDLVRRAKAIKVNAGE